MTSSALAKKQYRGITDENCLYWCHGTVGLEHHKVRKFRYPLWKYAHVSHRIVSCVCLNCNMQFYGELAAGVPLSIPVSPLSSYFAVEIPVRASGRLLALHGEVVRPFRHITQEMLNDQTRLFIELVQ
ncbi:MAG TPA: hypothetical protein VFQ70_03870 [Candidatus Saccharimonadaceae bacterium]|nr:hypothetical protein [Candidatus Saccharimonadaceae bacterium]